MNKNNLCEAEVRKNIVLVETGGELTIPLRILNQNCEFKKKWDEIYNKWHPDEEAKVRKKAYYKAYYQKPEVKARNKAYHKAYYQRKKLTEKKNEFL